MRNFRLRVMELFSNTERPSVHVRTASTTVTTTTTTTTTTATTTATTTNANTNANTTALEPNFGSWTHESPPPRFCRLVPNACTLRFPAVFLLSLFTASTHLPFGFHIFRLPYIFPFKIFLDVLDLSNQQTCPAHSNLLSSICSYIYVLTQAIDFIIMADTPM
jgi:hypothetical protein